MDIIKDNGYELNDISFLYDDEDPLVTRMVHKELTDFGFNIFIKEDSYNLFHVGYNTFTPLLILKNSQMRKKII